MTGKKHNQQNCPVGQITSDCQNRVKPQNKKYFAFPEGRNSGISVAIQSRQEGRSRSSRNAGRGAVDAEVPVTKVPKRTAKTCGPDTATLVSSWWVKSR